MLQRISYWPGFFMLLLWACQADNTQTDNTQTDNTHTETGKQPPAPLFRRVPASESGIVFENTLTSDLDNNIFEYDYFYNGAGVGAADFNGRPDGSVFQRQPGSRQALPQCRRI
jgi:hypothetical protein